MDLTGASPEGAVAAMSGALIPMPDHAAMSDPSSAQAPVPGDLNPQLIGTDWWTDDMVVRAGIPIVDVPFVSVGGGIGSLVMVDYLRIVGVPTSAIRVLTTLDKPWDSYEYLTRVSQIPRN